MDGLFQIYLLCIVINVFFSFSSTSNFPLFETQTKLELAIFHPSNFLKLDKTQDCLIQKILEMEIQKDLVKSEEKAYQNQTIQLENVENRANSTGADSFAIIEPKQTEKKLQLALQLLGIEFFHWRLLKYIETPWITSSDREGDNRYGIILDNFFHKLWHGVHTFSVM